MQQLSIINTDQLTPGVRLISNLNDRFTAPVRHLRLEEIGRDPNKNPVSFSYTRGMWMKVALASSLAYRPRLLVLDEPFSGLDPLVREELIEGLLESAAESTILV